MDVAIHIFNCVIDDGVIVLRIQTLVRRQFIGENRGSSFHMLTHLLLELGATAILNDHGADFSATLQYAHDHGFIFSASASDDARTFAAVHVSRLATDESFVDFDVA